MRVLAVVAAPHDKPSFDAGAAWTALDQALTPLARAGKILHERLDDPTELALKRRLAGGDIDVVHFIGHGHVGQAKYATLSLLATDGRARKLTAQYIAKLFGTHRVRLAVLQVVGGPFANAGEIQTTGGLEAVVTTGHFPGALQTVFARSFYAHVAGGTRFDEAIEEARRALGASGASQDAKDIVGYCRTNGARIMLPERQQLGFAASAEQPEADRTIHVSLRARAQASAQHAQRELECKRLAGAFDVFLCHNRTDKPAVKQIAQRLKARGILPWLDEWELPPGQPWQPLLEQQIRSIKSAAVFVGAGGVGPWQEQELYGFLREFVSRRAPVIPVLLADAPDKPQLPLFLNAMTWVEFCEIDPDPLAQLIWGITGHRIVDDQH